MFVTQDFINSFFGFCVRFVVLVCLYFKNHVGFVVILIQIVSYMLLVKHHYYFIHKYRKLSCSTQTVITIRILLLTVIDSLPFIHKKKRETTLFHSLSRDIHSKLHTPIDKHFLPFIKKSNTPFVID